jgi:hypothetical protein
MKPLYVAACAALLIAGTGIASAQVGPAPLTTPMPLATPMPVVTPAPMATPATIPSSIPPTGPLAPPN